MSGSCPRAWCSAFALSDKRKVLLCETRGCIGVAEKFVRVFHNIVQKTRTNFLATPVFIPGVGNTGMDLCGPWTPNARSLPHPPPRPSMDQSSLHTATKELPPTGMSSSLQNWDCPLQQSLTCALTMLVPFFPVTLKTNPSPTPPIPPGPAGLWSPDL